jgi:MFS family permease
MSFVQLAVALVCPVYLPGFLHTAAGAIAAPTLTLLAVDLGGGKAAAGAALSLRAGSALVAQFPAGRLLAYAGARVTMAVAGAIETLGAAMVAAAAGRESFNLLRLSLALLGLGSAVWEVARQAQIQRAIPPHVRGKAVALYCGLVRIAAVGGPVVGGLLGQAAGLPAVFAAEALVLALAAAAALRFVDPHKRGSPSERTGMTKTEGKEAERQLSMLETLRTEYPRFLTAGVASSLLSVVRGARAVALPLLGSEIGMSRAEIGACLSVAMAIETPMFIPVGWAYDRFGRKPVVVPAALVIAAAWTMLARVGSSAGMWSAAALLGVGNGLASGIGTLTCQDFAPGEKSPHTPNYFALWNVLTGLATMAAPSMVGYASQRWSVFTAARVTAGISVAAATWYVVAVPEMQHAAQVRRSGTAAQR